MKYRLFLDDVRNPIECIDYMYTRIGAKNPVYLEKWIIVRNYDQFVDYITRNGLPEVISFDHDLSFQHYGMYDKTDHVNWKEYYNDPEREMTGYDCAKWLCDYCAEKDLPLPECYIHSYNREGSLNIKTYLENFKKHR